MGNSSFEDLYRNTFQLSSVHNETISKFFQVEEHSSAFSLSWDLHLRRDMRDEEVNKLSSSLVSLESVRLVDGVDDTRVWEGDSLGAFSVIYFYESFFPISGFPLFTLFHVNWKRPIPPKVQVFSWTAVLGKLPY